MTTVHDISERYVERFAALDPVEATGLGITGHDSAMTDYSPDASRERAEHNRTTLRGSPRRRPRTPVIARPWTS